MATVAPAAHTILGRPLALRIASPAVAAWLERHWLRGAADAAPHPYRIALEETETVDDDAPDGWTPVEVRLPDGITMGWENRGRAWRWREGSAVVRVRFAGDGAEIGFRAPADDRGEETSPSNFFPALYVAVCETLRESGLVPLHAAVVVRDGRATALAAPSGTGKTTTLLRLLGRGWRPLAEDLSWLDPATGTLHGWDRGLRLWQDGVERMGPELAGAEWSTDSDGKRFLPWDALGVERVTRARLTRVIVLERDASRPTGLEPLAPRDAVRVLWQAMGVPLSADVRASVSEHVARMARELDFGRLRLGPDSEADLPTLGAL